MHQSLKVITQLPLQELWRDDGFTTTTRLRWLSANDIKNMLQAGPVQFVVADCGTKPWWVDSRDCYDFWKKEVKPHLAEGSRIVIEDSPDEYCYVASQWSNREGEPPIVVLEKHH